MADTLDDALEATMRQELSAIKEYAAKERVALLEVVTKYVTDKRKGDPQEWGTGLRGKSE